MSSFFSSGTEGVRNRKGDGDDKLAEAKAKAIVAQQEAMKGMARLQEKLKILLTYSQLMKSFSVTFDFVAWRSKRTEMSKLQWQRAYKQVGRVSSNQRLSSRACVASRSWLMHALLSCGRACIPPHSPVCVFRRGSGAMAAARILARRRRRGQPPFSGGGHGGAGGR